MDNRNLVFSLLKQVTSPMRNVLWEYCETMGGGGRHIGFGYGMIREMASKSGLMARVVGSWILTTIRPVQKPKQWYHLAYTHTDADNKLV